MLVSPGTFCTHHASRELIPKLWYRVQHSLAALALRDAGLRQHPPGMPARPRAATSTGVADGSSRRGFAAACAKSPAEQAHPSGSTAVMIMTSIEDPAGLHSSHMLGLARAPCRVTRLSLQSSDTSRTSDAWNAVSSDAPLHQHRPPM